MFKFIKTTKLSNNVIYWMTTSNVGLSYKYTYSKGAVIFNSGYRGGRIFYTNNKIVLAHSRTSIKFDTPFQDSKIFHTPLLSYLAWIYGKNLHTMKHNLDIIKWEQLEVSSKQRIITNYFK